MNHAPSIEVQAADELAGGAAVAVTSSGAGIVIHISKAADHDRIVRDMGKLLRLTWQVRHAPEQRQAG